MTETMAWLLARAPGFNHLSQDERDAIADFCLLWSLFESRVLETHASAARICAQVESWRHAGTLDATLHDDALAYFRHRYFADGEFTYHFEHLHFRPSDREALVRAVINATNDDPADRIAAMLIIILRYRNNLFHGIKWQYKLVDQFGNFTQANTVLMRVLDQHGRLADG